MSYRDQLRIRTRLRIGARRVGWHVVPMKAFDVVPRSYYSPILDTGAVPDTTWDRVSPMEGVAFDVEAQFNWAETHLSPYIAQFKPPVYGDPTQPRFFVANDSFQTGDAEVLYAMLRDIKPQRVVELGSGFSTLVMAEALEANSADGHDSHLNSYDPFPPANIAGHSIPGLYRHHPQAAQDVPLEVFTSLTARDVLFVDTTHRVTVGSEVNRVILDVLPLLASGVLVHFHDIWLPYEYHRGLIDDVGVAWAEQYLLQAFLSGNPGYEVLMGLQAMMRLDPRRLKRLIPTFDLAHYPTGFWLRRT